MPGVSMKTICASGSVTTPCMEVRVVCGLSATMATFCPTSALSRVDLPALGRPTIETKPDRNDLSMSYRLRFTKAYLFHAQLVAGQNVDADAVPLHRFAGFGNAAEPLGYQTADGGRSEIVLWMEGVEQV